ncbi:omega-hydroxypalmitate O-feruloyl transferase-like [Eucalyptus grandis]|uniref:omega-hydroxypalmitate O-feruloyl transferase-like n=1 Tax=Eucalyptus grandis TaxID=71139 RepID=UPI00192EC47E|nr:omega-hydroxypalmitate O-feruloyl transferase-like [Eucalyptus grandis]
MIEIVFAFKGGGRGSCSTVIETIRASLAEVLVDFYPFAGRLVMGSDGKMAATCTGEGVLFVEAMSDDDIGMLGNISVINPGTLRKLVKHSDGAQTIVEESLLTVQVTTFKCGGITVGIVMNHVLVDGKALADFLTCWSDVAQGRSFYFEPHTLIQLKKLSTITTHDGSSIVPTSFEVISALVWIARTKALGMDPHETTKLLTAVDGRPKFDPPLPSGYFGNGIAWSCAECSAGELTRKPFSFAVRTVQEALRCVTESYIRSAIDHVELNRVVVDYEGNACCISKWSRLSFYETDFGFGRPFQVAPTMVPHNLVLVASQSGETDNLVLSLGLPRDAMDVFSELIQSELALMNKY